jgi:hypothetical protein
LVNTAIQQLLRLLLLRTEWVIILDQKLLLLVVLLLLLLAAAGAAEESLSIHHVVYSNYMFTAYLRPSMTELVYKVHKEFET